MSKKTAGKKAVASRARTGEGAVCAEVVAQAKPSRLRSSKVVDTRVVWCGDCLEQLKKLPGGCVDLI